MNWRRKHGHTTKAGQSHEYHCWSMMKQRCLNPKATAFWRYGAVGIAVCERWLSFANFIEDMGPAPSSKHSLDRWPDSAGNYEPGNVRWATQTEQMAHARRTKHRAKLTADQVLKIRESLALGRRRADIAAEHGISYHSVTDIALGRTWKDAVAI